MRPAVLLGQAIGDALGMPFEKLGDEVHEDLARWDGLFWPGTFHDLPPGHYTDDTEMAECLALSITQCASYNARDAAGKYLYWIRDTPHGAGDTTKKALRRFGEHADTRTCGVGFDDPKKVGSGPAMRAAPIGAYFRNRYQIWKVCEEDAQITHVHREAVASSYAVALAVRLAIEGFPPVDLLDEVIEHIAEATYEKDEPITLVQEHLRTVLLSLQERVAVSPLLVGPNIGRRGNASQITATALHCALFYDNFRDGVVAAVKLGGDADTRGAIAGAILGARFGLEGIPEEYVRGVKDAAKFGELDRKLVRV